MCNFVEDRTATIRVDGITGPRFDLQSGVPQGSVLSPTLFIFYTAQMQRPPANCIDISFADDNTQVILYPLRSKETLATMTSNEINRINSYEKKWKIKTNNAKFQLLSVSATKPHNVEIEGEQIPFSTKAKIPGMEISTRGVVPHMKKILTLAKQ